MIDESESIGELSVTKPKLTQFTLFHTTFGETVEVILMDEDLLNPEAGIVDIDTMTLRPLKKGGVFTLIPAETSHTLAVLARIHQVHTKVTTTGCALNSQWSNRMDDMLMAVDLLFKKVPYKLVECKEDMQNLVDPPDDLDWQPKIVEVSAFGELLKAECPNIEEQDAAMAPPTTDG